MDNDLYIVFLRKDGTRLYYKNRSPHREDGPAIIPPQYIEQYKGLLDEKLYKEVLGTEFRDAVTKEVILETAYKILRFNTVQYFLNGIYHTEKQFYSFTLKEKMEKELQVSKEITKKLKI